MQCSRCGYMLSAFDKDCPRCTHLAGQSLLPTPPPPVVAIKNFGKTGRWYVTPGMAVLAIVALIGFIFVSRPGTKAPKVSAPIVPNAAPTGDASVQPSAPAKDYTPASVQPAYSSVPPPVPAVAPGNSSSPVVDGSDMVAYLGFVQQADAKRMEIKRRPLPVPKPATGIKAYLNAGQDQETRQNEAINALHAAISEGMNTALADFDRIIMDVKQKACPSDCQYVKSTYLEFLTQVREYNAASIRENARLDAMRQTDPEGTFQRSMHPDTSQDAELSHLRDVANSAIMNVCVQYRMNRPFLIQ